MTIRFPSLTPQTSSLLPLSEVRIHKMHSPTPVYSTILKFYPVAIPVATISPHRSSALSRKRIRTVVRSDTTDAAAIEETTVEKEDKGGVASSKKPSVVSPIDEKELKKVG
jgi:hypothetical protein